MQKCALHGSTHKSKVGHLYYIALYLKGAMINYKDAFKSEFLSDLGCTDGARKWGTFSENHKEYMNKHVKYWL